jgi:uncharacterized protein (TIGR02099 family)
MTPPSDRPPTLARELSARAQAFEHAFEEAVGERLEHGLHIAEESIARRYGAHALRSVRLAVRVLGWLLVATFFAFGLLLLALRYWLLPDIDAMRPRIESIASSALKAPVTIGRVQASWHGLNPVLAMDDVQITGASGGAALALPRIEGTLSWTSVPAMAPRFARLRIHAPELDVALLEGGAVSVAGIVIDPKEAGGGGNPALDFLLAQRQLLIRDARVTLRDVRVVPARDIVFSDADFLLESGFGTHRFGLRLAPPPAFAAPVDLRGEFRPPAFGRKSDFRRWSGELFAQVDYVDLAQLNQWIQAPIKVQRANGALRAWIRFDDADVVGATADLALKDVDAQLAQDLKPLQMSSLQGRVAQSRWGDEARGGQEVKLAGVTFVMANGAQFPPLDLSYRYTRASRERPQQFEVDGSRIDLPSLAGVATHLPLGRSLLETIERYAPQGRLSEFSMRWEGPEPEWRTMTAKAKFDELSIAAQPATEADRTVGTPGFERLSGTVQLDHGAGALKLSSSNSALVFPGVFQEPRIALNQLQADIKWKSGDRAETRVDALHLANADFDISGSGSWRAAAGDKGAGQADFIGRIARLDARRIHRYVPLAAGEGTLSWLQHALLEGRIDEGSFRLRGDLSRFPFPAPADGEFRVAARLRGGVLDVAPAADANGRRTPGTPWPLLREIDADLLFERQGMTIRAQRGTIGGARISETTARIPDLGHDATLEVRGQVAGALADMLGYVNASPVARWTGGVTRGVEARGPARLDLKLDIPLLRTEATRATGALQLQNNDIVFADVPPFSRVSGVLNFDERGVRFNNLTGGFLGGQARFDATTRDGATAITATGMATAVGLKRAIDVGVVQRILDRAQGSARYTASLTAHGGGLVIQADSDLVGLTIEGIAPLRKSAGEALPLRMEKSSRAGQDDLRVTAGRLVGLHLERRQDGETMRLTRGVIAVNETANLPESGMLVLISMPRFDLEAWSSWLGINLDATASPRPASTDSGFRVDHAALRTAELVIGRRTFRNVTLGATRTDAGGFDTNVVSDGVVGYIGWRPGPAGSTGGASLGHVTARLSKFVIPASKKVEVVDVLQTPSRQYPSFEVAIDNFEMGDVKLGRLELAAANSGTGAAAAWQLSRLDVTNPDMKVSASGDWSPTSAGARRMRINFAFDAIDAGATLGRFGIPGAVSRGHGKLEGKLEWIGSPLEIDYPTLSGAMSLRVDDGRFMQVDNRGAGRLLTLLSLQSLSRTLMNDARESFGEGFAFNVIKADATVTRGVIATENFSMTGAGAAALISGSVNLANETQQLHLVVLPEIDASTAALAIGVANPIIGLGALLANMVLKAPLSRAFALEYDITGTIGDPVITRRGRVAANPSEPVR